jgi:GxxExxY protein
MKHQAISRLILGAFYDVYNELGHGFLEKVYEKVMVIELEERGLSVQPQAPIEVLYRGLVIGEYYADILVNDCIIVELKAVEMLLPEHHAQLLNYLKATRIEVGLLFNFGSKPEFKRKIHDLKNTTDS